MMQDNETDVDGPMEDLALSAMPKQQQQQHPSSSSSLLAALTSPTNPPPPVVGDDIFTTNNNMFTAADSDDDEDLFGPRRPTTTITPTSSSNNNNNNNNNPSVSSPLSNSVLMGGTIGDGSCGLFDELDAAEERNRLHLEQERMEQEKAEALRREELRRQEEASLAEARRLQEEEQRLFDEENARRQQQQQQQTQQQQNLLRESSIRSSMSSNEERSVASGIQPPPPASFYRKHHTVIDDPLSHMCLSSSEPSNSLVVNGDNNNMPSSLPPPLPVVPPPPIPPPSSHHHLPPPIPPPPPRHHQQPSLLAGLHNGPSSSLHHSSKQFPSNNLPIKLPCPPPFTPLYDSVTVSSPRLHKTGGIFSKPPHWTYEVRTRSRNGSEEWSVRRRFKHFVALEERLRESCPGSILPPRPDKHPTRALEEGLQQQTPQFAHHRSIELQTYLRLLLTHPFAGPSLTLRTFLTLPDHIGTAWPEVSHSLMTRAAVHTTNAAVHISEGTNGLLAPTAGEDNAVLLAVSTYEGLRMGGVIQSIPKLEGSVALIREQGERSGTTAMELSKLAKGVNSHDRELSRPIEQLSQGMLRSSRRTKRLSQELAASMAPMGREFRMVQNIRGAFHDRRMALLKKGQSRFTADAKARRLAEQVPFGYEGERLRIMEGYEIDAANSDEIAMEADKECREVGKVLLLEVSRLKAVRTKEWMDSLKVMASAWREHFAETVGIWENALGAIQPLLRENHFGVDGSSCKDIVVSSGGMTVATSSRFREPAPIQANSYTEPTIVAIPPKENTTSFYREEENKNGTIYPLMDEDLPSSNNNSSNNHDNTSSLLTDLLNPPLPPSSSDTLLPSPSNGVSTLPPSSLLGELLGNNSNNNNISSPYDNDIVIDPSSSASRTPSPMKQPISSLWGPLLGSPSNPDHLANNDKYNAKTSQISPTPPSPTITAPQQQRHHSKTPSLQSSLMGELLNPTSAPMDSFLDAPKSPSVVQPQQKQLPLKTGMIDDDPLMIHNYQDNNNNTSSHVNLMNDLLGGGSNNVSSGDDFMGGMPMGGNAGGATSGDDFMTGSVLTISEMMH